MLAGVGLVLTVLSVWQIGATARGLEVNTVRDADPRLVVLAPEEHASGSRPVVLIAHGLAGSTPIMRGFALTLAHAGYTAVLWDFQGHGTNPEPMVGSMGERSSLQATAEAALTEALARGYGDPERVAILGHSMGSGVALNFGIDHGEVAATIAVSPADADVTPELPRNLLLIAGALEGRFVQNAEELLADAGGKGGDPDAGTARDLLIAPGVEHISILFSPAVHAAARDWLDATFGAQPGARNYTDRRILWYGLGVMGVLLLGAGLAPLTAEQSVEAPRRSLWRRMGALVGGALGATLILWLLGWAGLDLSQALGVLVGGYLLLWYGVAGVLNLLLLWERPRLPSLRAVLGGLCRTLAGGRTAGGVGLAAVAADPAPTGAVAAGRSADAALVCGGWPIGAQHRPERPDRLDLGPQPGTGQHAGLGDSVEPRYGVPVLDPTRVSHRDHVARAGCRAAPRQLGFCHQRCTLCKLVAAGGVPAAVESGMAQELPCRRATNVRDRPRAGRLPEEGGPRGKGGLGPGDLSDVATAE